MYKNQTYALMQNLCKRLHNKKQPLHYQKRRFYPNLCTYADFCAYLKKLCTLCKNRRIIHFNYIYNIFLLYQGTVKVA